MCGIWGWVGNSLENVEDLTKRVSALLHHRGPDDQGFVCRPEWGLGFLRLSILDLSPTGHQPMCTPDGRYWIVFNGEIYNYIELRRTLEAVGEVFCSTSDTEVLLRLLIRDGVKALTKLNGMFALAFIDTQDATFLLARDRLGVKPLYFTIQNGQLRFGSELKALLAWPGASRTINPTALVEYMALNYLPSSLCIFEGYQKLLPAHYLSGSLKAPDHAELHSYWKLDLNINDTGPELSETGLDDLANLLQDAVRIRMRSDVPVGLFLSGGIDSGLVAALAGSGNCSLSLALTVGLDEKGFDETALARASAQRSGLDHRVVHATGANLELVDTLSWFYDEPFGDASAVPSYLVCQAGKPFATVFLTGDGGDEAFAGYRPYIESRRLVWVGKIPGPLRSALRVMSSVTPVFSSTRHQLLKTSLPDLGFAAWFERLPCDPILDYIAHPNLHPYISEVGQNRWSVWKSSDGYDITTRQQALDFALYLPDDILVKMDRASMAHSMETRSPFLDYRVVEWAARQPRRNLLNDHQGKLPLRRLAKRFLPESVQNAPKHGFGVPLDDWFREPSNLAFIRERLLSSEASQRCWWDVEKVENMISAHTKKRTRALGEWLWRLLMLDSWARYYADSTSFLEKVPL